MRDAPGGLVICHPVARPPLRAALGVSQAVCACSSCLREAKEKNRESWYMAYIMDTNEEERAKVSQAALLRRRVCRDCSAAGVHRPCC